MQDLLALAQAGPVAILLVGLVAVVRMFLSGAIVPGWVYKAEREKREAAEAQVLELVKAARVIATVAANGGPQPGASGG